MYDKAELIYQQWAQVQQGTPQGNLVQLLINELHLTESEALHLAYKLHKKYQ